MLVDRLEDAEVCLAVYCDYEAKVVRTEVVLRGGWHPIPGPNFTSLAQFDKYVKKRAVFVSEESLSDLAWFTRDVGWEPAVDLEEREERTS